MADRNIEKIRIGTASCGLAAGAAVVRDFIRENLPDVAIEEVGCIGHCYAEPLVEVITGGNSILYRHVEAKEEWLERIKSLSEEGRFEIPPRRKAKERPKVTRLAGIIDPLSVDEYVANGGYEGLSKARRNGAEWVLDEMRKSGLRGRGGGGFPTGTKWGFLAVKKADEKVLICNADEGDPGAFMDRSMMESVPHQVLEGMLIGAFATGATKLFIYCRAEYPLAVRNMNHAIGQAVARGFARFADRELDIRLLEGAGAFVCGEETAMIASLEGKRGTPRFRPPFPTDKGWLGHPSAINNVETFANVPLIIAEGGESFATLGTEKSRGTKIFALAGDLRYPGLVEVPMGITLGEIVYDIGGAEPGDVKAVQTGGPSGGCIPAELFDTPVDYDSLNALGAIMGSGGMIVIGKNRCMVETARYFLDFTHRESCGKCTFCRVGTKRMFETLERITGGKGEDADLEFLKEMGAKVKKGSLCGLGQTAPNPVLSTLRYFPDEYEAHVRNRQCPALQCNALVDVKIDPSRCIQCKICIKNCPVKAISNDFVVDNALCTRCNTCIEMCPKDTIFRVPRGEGEYRNLR
jgi:NADH-quinone oxidoreductase subunit F